MCVWKICNEQGQFKWLSYEIVLSQKVQKSPVPLFQGWVLAQSADFFFLCQACLHPAVKRQVMSVCHTVVNVGCERDEHEVAQ